MIISIMAGGPECFWPDLTWYKGEDRPLGRG